MAFRFPSGSNTFVPNWEATGMVVSATRDPSKFKLPRYIQYVGVDKRVFYYLKLDLDEPARVPTTGEYAWAPGADSPAVPNQGTFQFVEAATTKYAIAWTLPQEAVDQAPWDIQNSQLGIIQQKSMTIRTMLVQTLVQTSSNWPSTNTGSVNSLNGGAGKFSTASADPSSANYLAIKKALQAAATAIVLQTNAVMKWNDIVFVCSPPLANGMGASGEMFDYVKGSPDAKSRQRGEGDEISEYGLPPSYAGIKMEVEDAVRVTTRPNASSGYGTGGTRGWVWQDANPVLMTRKGGVVGQFGGTPLSTIQLYTYRNMEVKNKNDVDNERVVGRIVDDVVALMPFGQSGYCIQGAA